MTRRGLAVIDIDITGKSCETFWTQTGKRRDLIPTLATVKAGVGETVVKISLTFGTFEAFRTETPEAID